jgi:hypothetical protein
LTLLHALCLLRGGHVPGGAVVWTYRVEGDRQHPFKRRVTVEILAVECARCGARLKAGA